MNSLSQRLGVFANKWFTLYFTAATLSKVGSQIYQLAIPWMVLQMTHSVANMSIIWVVETAPFIILGPFLGVMVDRLNRRKIMLWSDFLRAVLVVLLPVLQAFHLLGMWYLYVLAFSLTIFSLCFDLVADFGVIPQLVQKDQLNSANSANLGIQNLSNLLGPALAGGFIALVGAANALYVDGISYFVTFVVIYFLPINFNPANGRPKNNLTIQNVLNEIKDGFSFIRKSNILGVLSLSSVLKNLATAALFVVMTYRLGHELGLNSGMVGTIYSILGCMTLLGSFLAPRLIKRLPLGTSLMTVTWIGLLGAAGLALLPNWQGQMVGYAVLNLTTSMANVYTLTVRQREIPNEYMGRANSVYRMILMSSFPLSAVILGGLANAYGSKSAFCATGVLMLVATLFMLFSRIPRYREEVVNRINKQKEKKVYENQV